MDVTNHCNLDCIQCTLASARERSKEAPGDMPVELFRKIAREVFPYARDVALSCEAEPTVHRHFGELLAILGETPGPTYIMTTNGTTLTRRKIGEILDSGLAGINVSIDGATPETFARIRRPGRLDRVVEAVEEINRQKAERGRGKWEPWIQVNATLMRSTIDELPALVERCHGWGVRNLTLQHVYETEQTGLDHESLLHDVVRSDAILAECLARCARYGIETNFPPLFLADPEPAPAAAVSCHAPFTMVRIRWDGVLEPCDHWRRRPYADLRTTSFADIWTGTAAATLRDDHARCEPRHESCVGCIALSTDNLEGRPSRRALVFTDGIDAERYLELASAGLPGMPSDAAWDKVAPALRLLARDPGVPVRAIHEALDKRSWGDVAAAIAGARDPNVLSGMASLCHAAGALREAHALLASYVELARSSAPLHAREDVHLARALRAAESGDHGWAEAQASAASSIGGYGSVDGALAAARPSSLATLSSIFRLRGDDERAARFLERYLEASPRAPDHRDAESLLIGIWSETARRARETGDGARAAALYGRVQARRPDPAVAAAIVELSLRLALDGARSGRLDGTHVSEALRHEATLGRIAIADGDDVIDANLGAIIDRCRTPHTLSTLANIELARGRSESAARLFRRYVEVDPTTPDRAAVENLLARLECAPGAERPAVAAAPRGRGARLIDWLSGSRGRGRGGDAT
ncbi:MAG: radical SAM protein [Acidobacteriota bacterium]